MLLHQLINFQVDVSEIAEQSPLKCTYVKPSKTAIFRALTLKNAI